MSEPTTESKKSTPNLSGLLAAGKTANAKTSEKPSGKFADLGGIERRPVYEFEKPEKPIDFSEVSGKVVQRGKLRRYPYSVS